MTFIGKCFGTVSNCFYGTGEWKPSPTIPIMPIIPDVILDTSCMGKYWLCYNNLYHMVMDDTLICVIEYSQINTIFTI